MSLCYNPKYRTKCVCISAKIKSPNAAFRSQRTDYSFLFYELLKCIAALYYRFTRASYQLRDIQVHSFFRLALIQNVLIMKVNEIHYFSYLFDKVLYMFRTCPLSIIRSIATLYTRNRYVILVLLVSASVVRTKLADTNRTRMTNT